MPYPQMPRGLRPSAQQYGFDAPSGAVRTDVAGGAGRYAEQFSRSTQYFDITLMLDLLEFSIWNTFFLRRIAKGTIPFEMPLDSGYGVSPHVCQVLPDSYKASRTNGVGMVVSFRVEAENQAYDLAEADVDALLSVYEVYGPDLSALLRRLDKFATKDLLVLQN